MVTNNQNRLEKILDKEISLKEGLNSQEKDQKGLTSVVILSYNRKEDLEKNIESLYQKTNLPFETIIYDNGSEKETIEYLKNLERRTKFQKKGGLKVIYNKENIGCSAGRKEAIKHAKGEYIYTVDNDMTYCDNWLEKLVETIEKDKKIGAVSSQIIFPDGKIQLNGGKLELEDNYFAKFIEIDAGKDKNSKDLFKGGEVDWVPGGATLFRREVFDKLKLSERYLNGYEDYDISIQLKKEGYKLVSCPKSKVTHHHIQFYKEKIKKEKGYIKDRWNPERTWKSLIAFLDRTGINVIKNSSFYKWVEKDGSKPFLNWTTEENIKKYTNLFPNKPLSELTNEELKQQFTQILKENKEGKLKNFKESYNKINPIQQLKESINLSYETYNLINLERHLNWATSNCFDKNPKNKEEYVNYLINDFKKYVKEKDSKKAEEIYKKLETSLSDFFIEYQKIKES